jgi:hypothetical protein
MKSIIKSGSIISVSIVLLIAFTTITIEANGITDTPVIVIPKSEIDLKEVREGTLLEHGFTVYNKGNSLLEIKRVKTT